MTPLLIMKTFTARAVERSIFFLLFLLPLPISAVFAGSDDRGTYRKSYEYEKAKDYKRAVKAVMPVYRDDPYSYRVNLRLGRLYYLGGSNAKSMEHYRKSMLAVPGSVEAKLGYLQPLMKQKSWAEAEKVLDGILKIDSYNYWANLLLARVFKKQKKLGRAEKTAKKMLVLYPTDSSFLKELELTKKEEFR